MCALRAHIKLSVFKNIFSRIEKVITAFSIPEKMFPKTESLMCALRAHISKILLFKVIKIGPVGRTGLPMNWSQIQFFLYVKTEHLDILSEPLQRGSTRKTGRTVG